MVAALLYRAAMEATEGSHQVVAAAVEPLKPERNLAQAELVAQAWQSLRHIFKMDETPVIEDWVILDGESIENMIRWNGSTQTWPLPEGRIAIKRNEFDFSNATQHSEPT